MTIAIKEIKSDQLKKYKLFFSSGLISDGESFRITPNDDLNTPFPTKDCDDSFTLSAFAEDRMVGVVSFTRDGSDREKLRHKGIMFRMLVDKDFRGVGVGNMLIEALLKRVSTVPNIEQINLTVVAGNVTATNLYEKFGFRLFGTEENAIKWENKYFTEQQMVLNLKEAGLK